jgi:diguanylate cyclase (GGDEF)-like protein/PAS domain S-box-containing protein
MQCRSPLVATEPAGFDGGMADDTEAISPGVRPDDVVGSDDPDELWSVLHESRHDIEALLGAIAARVVALLGDGCVITTVGPDGTTLQPRAVVHTDPKVQAAMRAVLSTTPARLGEGIAGTAAADRRSIVLSGLEPATVAETTPRQFLPFVRDHPMRAIAVVPLLSGGELVGTLGSVRTSNDDGYSLDDVRHLESLAERAAHAMDEALAGPRAIGPADFEAIYRYHPDGVLLTTPDGHVLAANPAACATFGLTEREIMHRGREGLVDLTDPRLEGVLAERAASGRFRSELTLVRGDGTRFIGDVTSAIFTSRDQKIRTVVTFRDVTDEVATRELAMTRIEELERTAGRDPLTGLWNRQSFAIAAEHVLASADRRGTSTQVVFIDLDGLKQINDTLGHRAGDAAIVALGSVIDRSLRDADLACRLGGDEFVLLVADSSSADLRLLVDRIIAGLAAAAEGSIRFSISVGSVERPAGATSTLDELIDAADRDMYQQKVLRHLSGQQPGPAGTGDG